MELSKFPSNSSILTKKKLYSLKKKKSPLEHRFNLVAIYFLIQKQEEKKYQLTKTNKTPSGGKRNPYWKTKNMS